MQGKIILPLTASLRNKPIYLDEVTFAITYIVMSFVQQFPLLTLIILSSLWNNVKIYILDTITTEIFTRYVVIHSHSGKVYEQVLRNFRANFHV